MFHKLGTTIQDCVSPGGGVADGVSMMCYKCRKHCVIILGRGAMTSPADVSGIKRFCPYCGTEGEIKLTGRVHDCRPIGGYD